MRSLSSGISLVNSMRLLRIEGNHAPTRKQLEAKSLLGRTTIIKLMGRFEDLGWVEIERSWDDHGVPNQVRYRLTDCIPDDEALIVCGLGLAPVAVAS